MRKSQCLAMQLQKYIGTQSILNKNGVMSYKILMVHRLIILKNYHWN